MASNAARTGVSISKHMPRKSSSSLQAALIPTKVQTAPHQTILSQANAAKAPILSQPQLAANRFVAQSLHTSATSEQNLASRFFHQLSASSSSRLSAAQFYSLNNNLITQQLTKIIDSFFPLDTSAKNPEIPSNLGITQLQRDIFLKVADTLGFTLYNNQLCLKDSFKPSQLTLLASPNGRIRLAQIIRSLHYSGNAKLANEFRTLLLLVARRYKIADNKMAYIVMATNKDCWQQAPKLASQDATVQNTISNAIYQLSLKSLIDFTKTYVPKPLKTATGNQISDYFLGYLTDKNGRYLRDYLSTLDKTQLVKSSSFALAAFFPTEKHVFTDLPIVSKDTMRCFRQNPLLRSSHRIIARIVLKEFGLNNHRAKGFSIAEGKQAQHLAWLQSANKEHRSSLLRMIKSLHLLQNTAFAENLRRYALSLLQQHYHALDRDQVLADFSQIIPTAPEITAPSQIQKTQTQHIAAEVQQEFTKLTADYFDAPDGSADIALQNYLARLASMSLSDEALISLLSTCNKNRVSLLSIATLRENKTILNQILTLINRLKTPKDKLAFFHPSQLVSPPILAAAKYGLLEVLEQFLRFIEQFDDKDIIDVLQLEDLDGYTALVEAASNDHHSCIGAILKAISKFDTRTQLQIVDRYIEAQSGSAICMTAHKGYASSAKVFLNVLNQCDSQTKDSLLQSSELKGYKAFPYSVKKNNTDVTIAMLDALQHLNPSQKRQFMALRFQGLTAYQWAIENHNIAAIRAIEAQWNAIEPPELNKAKVIQAAQDYCDDNSSRALRYYLHNLDKLALSKDELHQLISTKNEHDATALCVAAHMGDIELVNALLKVIDDIDPEHPDVYLSMHTKTGVTPIHLAASKGHTQIVKTFINKIVKAHQVGSEQLSIEINSLKKQLAQTTDNSSRKDLQREIKYKNLGRYRKLFLMLDKKDAYGKSALILAAKNNRTETVKLILDTAWSLLPEIAPLLTYTHDKRYFNCLEYAVDHGHLDTLQTILQHTPKFNFHDLNSLLFNSHYSGFHALNLAAKNGDLAIIKALLPLLTNENSVHIDTAIEKALAQEEIIALLESYKAQIA